MELIKLIIEYLFGKKYYANVVNRLGTEELMLSSYIFRTKEEAKEHRRELLHNKSFSYYCTITFRTKKEL